MNDHTTSPFLPSVDAPPGPFQNGNGDILAPDNMIDASSRFRPDGLSYHVTVRIEITFGFLLAVLRCLVSGKTLQIRHTYSANPFVHQEFEPIDNRAEPLPANEAAG